MTKTVSIAETPFGQFRPGPLAMLAVGFCRALPASWIAQRVAFILRKPALVFGPRVWDVTLDGQRLRLYPHDNVGERKFLFTPRRFDPQEMSLIATALPPGGVFVDIGANVGLYSLAAARRLGEGGRVIAIEPSPVALARLADNIGLNGYGDRIAVLPIAVGDRDGSVVLHGDPTNLGGSSLVRSLNGGDTVVQCRRLHDVMAEQGITGIDMLKIDVEGSEDRVLVPFFDTAPASLWPRHMIIERSTGWSADLLGLLTRLGYRSVAETRMNHILSRTA